MRNLGSANLHRANSRICFEEKEKLPQLIKLAKTPNSAEILGSNGYTYIAERQNTA
jgi:hypothetical protein